MNILHVHHDCIMSKLDELIAAIKKLSETPKDDCASIMTTGMICKTVVAVVGIIAGALLLWYLISLIAARCREKRNANKETKKQKEDTPLSAEQKREKQIEFEKERLFELKKQYQAKALCYIEEQAKNHIVEQTTDGEIKYEKARYSCGDDTYLTQIKEYITEIDECIKKLNANT